MNSTDKITPELRAFIKESLRQGSFYFSESTMEYFSCKVHGGFYECDPDNPYRGYFITSEQDNNALNASSQAWEGERRFTIRYANSPTEISDYSEFGQYATYEEAKQALSDMIRKAVKENSHPEMPIL